MQSNNLVEYCKVGLLHKSNRGLLTSESFQGVLNISGSNLKRKQIWTIFIDPSNPTAYYLQNHMGRFLSAAHDGKVSLKCGKTEVSERFSIHFDSKCSGEVALQSLKYSFYLEWNGNEICCFSKEPVWWGLRILLPPQLHIVSVHRSQYVRSGNGDSILKAAPKLPQSSKFLFSLKQIPLSSTSSTNNKYAIVNPTLTDFCRVAIRSHSKKYLRNDGTMSEKFDRECLFTFSFLPNKTPIFLLQNNRGEFLTVGSEGLLRFKIGSQKARREEYFALENPSIQVCISAFNEKYASVTNGLSFSTTKDEARTDKGIIFQLEYVGDFGRKVSALISSTTSPSEELSAASVSLKEVNSAVQTSFLSSGTWRLRSSEGLYWQIVNSGSAKLVEKACEEDTEVKLNYLSSYEENLEDGRKTINHIGGVVMSTLDGHTISTTKLGNISISEQIINLHWNPSAAEILQFIPLVNRPFIYLYSPIALGCLNCKRASQPDAFTLDCSNPEGKKFHFRRLASGNCQLFVTDTSRKWWLLTSRSNQTVSLVSCHQGPHDESGPHSAENEFSFFFISEKHILLRSVLKISGRTAFLCTDLKGSITLSISEDILPGCIWQI